MPTRIYAPDGSTGELPGRLAPTPDVLVGRRIGVLDNGKPGAASLLGHLAERLAERTGAQATGIRKKGSAATPCEAAVFDALVDDVDLVLTGTAD